MVGGEGGALWERRGDGGTVESSGPGGRRGEGGGGGSLGWQLVSSKGDHSCHALLPLDFDLNIIQGPRRCACLGNASGGLRMRAPS